MPKIPAPTQDILHLLAIHQEPLTLKQIQSQLQEYPLKDVKYALRRLREKGIIKSESNLLDMRRVFYRIATNDEISMVINNLKREELELYLSIIESPVINDEVLSTMVLSQ